MSHETGNIDFRILTPGQVHEGHGGHGHEGQRHVDREHVAEGHHGDGALDEDHGAKVMYICTERMSELAREMS